MALENFTGDISVYGLSIKIGLPTVSADRQHILIPYIGTADPDSETVSLSKYRYSLDNGVTYKDMTPLDTSEVSNLSFSPEGNSLIFKWDAKSDLNGDFYNKPIRIILQASEFGFNSAEVGGYFNFKRELINIADLNAIKVFPDYYEGISGNEFKNKKLPKTK